RVLTLPEWRLILYQNVGTKKHWLELSLTGPEGNRPAIGTSVEVETPDGVQFQQVGQADGAIRSQGHYRLYFGLGQSKTIRALKIFWANGRVQAIENPQADQLLKQNFPV
ncbi:MAG: ASPIC/UnbV domain-containing protein, partial [Cyanobacteria bacterium J06626_18]